MSQDTKPSASGALASTQTAVAPTVRVTLPDRPQPSDRAPVFAGAAAGTRYREQGLLGRGGMGEVRLFGDSLIGRDVAVKMIASGLADSSAIRERFLREVRIQGQLEHPSIVPVYDLGVDADGNEYFTMKRISGRTLASVLRALADHDAAAVAEFPLQSRLTVFRQVCLAIAYAHSRGVIHRDLKPANVMVGDFGEVYVLDWGIAAVADEPAQHDEQLLGTPGYMAPEQLDDPNQVDARADVYSLGAILFELLALEPWHASSSAAELIAATKTEREARPAQRSPQRDVPPELDDLCARATALARDDRVQTARELADAVDRYLEGDRDLERRRQQAQLHAAAARKARERVAAGGPDAMAARREALREAGRAVALDPDSRAGLRAALELMLEPPPEVPREVDDELERAQSDRIRAGIIPGLVVFATFLATALIVPLVAGPIRWMPPLVVAGALTIASISSTYRLRASRLATRSGAALLTAACVSVAIAFTSPYLGPMMIIPALAVALGNALVASQLRWRGILVLGVLSVTIPFVAEWAALIPRSYEFRADGILVLPVVMQLAELPIRIASLVATLGALIGSVLYVRRVILVETELRTRWVLHNWHLRQMAQMAD
jgi:eukaryotic-like serine/threonine-protein kinase